MNSYPMNSYPMPPSMLDHAKFVGLRTACRALFLLGCGLASMAASLPCQAQTAQTLEQRLLSEPLVSLAADARSAGDATRGAAIFYDHAMACSTCHSVGDRPAVIGPDLTRIDPQTSDAALVEAVLLPSQTIAPEFATVTVETVDGRLLTGVLSEETPQQIVLRNAAEPDKPIRINTQDIEQRFAAQQSIMPSEQVNRLADRGQFLDLIRYLQELRDGGVERARELQPAADPRNQNIPDTSLPWQPVVQRGEVAVEDNLKFPHAVAMGFVGGTVLFDANQLRTVATWTDGFVKHSPQNYFGLYWHRDGGPAQSMANAAHPLTFRSAGNEAWQTVQPPATSDPNTGSRFNGYQIGRAAVRLNYHVMFDKQRLRVSEDVRAERRPGWQGVARTLRVSDVPAGGQLAWSLSYGQSLQSFTASGEPTEPTDKLNAAPLRSFRVGDAIQVVRVQAHPGVHWAVRDATDDQPAALQIVATGNHPAAPLTLRVDCWEYQGPHAEPTATELASLVSAPPTMDDIFDQPPQPLTPPTDQGGLSQTLELARRPAVKADENIDEFSSTRSKFLRFVVTGVTGETEPGIDELEVYGADPQINLALAGKATASSVISGYPIHQIPHLNDGKLGNEHSWISAERNGGWAQIEFPEPVEMQRIVWARDRTGVCKDRLAVAYRIEVSDDGKHWQTVADASDRAELGTNQGIVQRDASPSYTIEGIPGPFPTWRPSDVVFADDGTMYAIAMTEGQIWRAKTPPVEHPQQVHWQRFASGLYHPIGLAVVDGKIYVAQKPEITELIDRDADGIADQYRTVATGWGLSTGWHEYTFGLAVDQQKNLWFALNTGYFWTNPGYVNPGRWRGSVMRVAHGTETLEQMATGCRVPNGITTGENGELFFTDNQGDWIQACKLAHIVPGRFYGHPETTADALPKETYPDGRSAVWLPYTRSRSVSGPIYDSTEGRFGPFAGQMFVGDVGYGANAGIMRVALEKVNGEYQGACFRFIDGQPLGCERMRFGPDDQLYMASLTSGLTRVAFDGSVPLAMHSVKIRPRGEGFVIHFTQPLAKDTRLQSEQIRVKRYHYLYSGSYGSPRADEQAVPVAAAELSADRRSITLSLPVETYPIGMVYEINVGALTGEAGEALTHNEAWYTVHQVPQ